jgi:hypothetical protein
LILLSNTILQQKKTHLFGALAGFSTWAGAIENEPGASCKYQKVGKCSKAKQSKTKHHSDSCVN